MISNIETDQREKFLSRKYISMDTGDIEGLEEWLTECEDFNKDDFDYPFYAWENGEGDWEGSPVLGEPPDDGFNSDVVDLDNMKVYWFQVGDNDEDSWIIFCKCQEYWILFEASCDYTGFDCQGGGTIFWSKDFSRMWNMGLTSYIRKELETKYEKNKSRNIKGDE